jgi:hypothetical protein
VPAPVLGSLSEQPVEVVAADDRKPHQMNAVERELNQTGIVSVKSKE